jgi:hypothetical protein
MAAFFWEQVGEIQMFEQILNPNAAGEAQQRSCNLYWLNTQKSNLSEKAASES